MKTDKKQKNSENPPEDLQNTFLGISDQIWRARVVSINDFVYCRVPGHMAISRGDFVVIPTRFGRDMARVLGPVRHHENTGNIVDIDRIATVDDCENRIKYEKDEKTAYDVCLELIKAAQIPMQLVAAHYILDRSRLLFLFTAENRIDFRELVRGLVQHFHIRIELRQIGVRDESRVIGGVAVCGRSLCCHSLTDRLAPVTLKMAKEQNLSLNSLKFSGPCSRLMCCLDYEYEHYVNERKKLPVEGSLVRGEGTTFKVTNVNIFSSIVSMKASDGRTKDVHADALVRRDKKSWEFMAE